MATSVASGTTRLQAGAAAPGCLSCHAGIEQVSPHDFDCAVCHRGEGSAADSESAHRGLVTNPGDLRVAGETCGLCHPGYVDRATKSLHATSAGIISGARYLWAAQSTKQAVYAVRGVADEDNDIPGEDGALPRLEQIPTFAESGEHIDDYLRKECLRCHLWGEGGERHGDYRSSGCSACHVLYAPDGLSRSGDPTVPQDEPGHPIKHEITTRIPAGQCQICHNRGNRIGVSFTGLMEADPYGSPWTETGEKQPKLHGKLYNHVLPDLHYERGLQCIDCHTSLELHGDGNIYSKKEEQIEIECTVCHGTPAAFSTLTSARGNRLSNLRRRGSDVLLTSKYDERVHAVPQLRALHERQRLPEAMEISVHLDKLECFACHDSWAPQCFGCHAKRDDRQTQRDLISGETTAGRWSENRSYLRWEDPVLGINPGGKVSPYAPGCQVLFTYIDTHGETVYHNKEFKTAAGFSGIAMNPFRPHTTRKKEVRTCESCHASRKALGLGSGFYDPQANGLPIDFEWERIVDEDGNPIQDNAHRGARPFNLEELRKISRVGSCLGCHAETDPAFWERVKESYGEAPDTGAHRQIIDRLFQRAATSRARNSAPRP